jgi:S1-C subfamily serine protease
MALRVKHVGQYSPHDVAKQAGFRNGDIIVAFDGRTDLLRETELLVYALNSRGEKSPVHVEILRGDQRLTLNLPRN